MPASTDLVATGIKDEQDVAHQIELVEQMIARHVNALVLAPADSKALVAAAQRAQQAGIVVVNIDNRFDRAVLAERHLTIPFVGPNNRTGARAVGDAVARRLKAGDPVAIVEGAPNAFNGDPAPRRVPGCDPVGRLACCGVSDWSVGNGSSESGRGRDRQRAPGREGRTVRQ